MSFLNLFKLAFWVQCTESTYQHCSKDTIFESIVHCTCSKRALTQRLPRPEFFVVWNARSQCTAEDPRHQKPSRLRYGRQVNRYVERHSPRFGYPTLPKLRSCTPLPPLPSIDGLNWRHINVHFVGFATKRFSSAAFICVHGVCLLRYQQVEMTTSVIQCRHAKVLYSGCVCVELKTSQIFLCFCGSICTILLDHG